MTAPQRFDQRDGWALSSHAALSMMLAIFPFCLSLAGQFNADVPQEDLIDLIIGSWPDAVAALTVREIRAVPDGGDFGSSKVSALLSVYFAFNGVDTLRLSFARACRGADPRPFLRTRMLSMRFVLLSALLVAWVRAVLIAAPLVPKFWCGAIPEALKVALGAEGARPAIAMALLSFAVFACHACHAWLPGTRP